jgi:DNA-binding MarR family transcriptional regulator
MPIDDDLRDTWARLMGLFLARRDGLFAVLTDLQLTPPYGHALMTLLRLGPARMRDLAELMNCDASYITSVADRLEQLGYAERRPAADDRRVKELALTRKGRAAAQRLDAVFTEPPAALGRLTAAERKALADISRKLFDGPTTADWMPPINLR